ncbi:MAG TPA: glutamate--tRNA ligase family protein, partial [Stellaceae bacterium]|nr:glutamate--tRNA ligase family protein [Stellaceae bacterium]
AVPEFAHVPLIHGPDGAKLSKRHGDLGVDAYRELGYLPEALRNYLLRLGWSHGDDEIISTEQAIEWFDIDAVGRAPARFDFAKLDNLNGHYIRAADDESLVALVTSRLEKLVGKPLTDIDLGRLREAMPELKLRPKTLVELAANARFLVAPRPIRPDDKAAKLLTPDARRLLAELLERFDGVEWQAERLEDQVRAFADQKGTKLGSIAQPLRAALTGSLASPSIFVVMKILGREESLGRIADAAGSTG